MALADDLAKAYGLNISKGVLFRPFEIFRAPDRQAECLRKGTTKVGAWGSAHQYGLAVDYVPYVCGKWSWQASTEAWDFLRKSAEARGLRCVIAWDRPHVEHPAFDRLREALKPQISGSLP